MTPTINETKNFTVIDNEGVTNEWDASNQGEFVAILNIHEVRVLVNSANRRNVIGFATLMSGGKYSQGPPIQQVRLDICLSFN